jgi:hypothetical protein
MMSERLGHWHFWLFFIGVNLTFFPMHQLGLEGMPRRIYTYALETGWAPLNLVSTIGAVIIDMSTFCFGLNVVWSYFRGQRALADPWGAATLEWAVPSPPPPFNFVRLPVVTSRIPLWTGAAPGSPTHVSGLAAEDREGLVTTVLDAVPDVRYGYPEPTIWPFVAALAIGFWLIVSMNSLQGFMWGMIPPAIAFIAWFWPRKDENAARVALEKAP